MLSPNNFNSKKLAKQLGLLVLIFQSLFFITGATKNVAEIFQSTKHKIPSLPTSHQEVDK